MSSTFKPLNTKDGSTAFQKTLLVATAGWGKTSQAKHFKRVYGPGFIVSGESGLSSVRSEGIDYLPFSSFDGQVVPSQNIYSFTEIVRLIKTPEFMAAGYKWLMLDSLTELSDLCYAWAEAKATAEAIAADKKVNGFDIWNYYKEGMIGGCKFIRDLPYHVVISALEKDGKDENDEEIKLPLVVGNAVQAQIPGIFDNVLYGVIKTTKEKQADNTLANVTRRYVVTGAYNGRNGKVRDENATCSLVEETGDITTILQKIAAGVKA